MISLECLIDHSPFIGRRGQEKKPKYKCIKNPDEEENSKPKWEYIQGSGRCEPNTVINYNEPARNIIDKECNQLTNQTDCCMALYNDDKCYPSKKNTFSNNYLCASENWINENPNDQNTDNVSNIDNKYDCSNIKWDPKTSYFGVKPYNSSNSI